MAPGRLPEIGSKFAPCEGECEHVDCKDTRRVAGEICCLCGRKIGYGHLFYHDGDPRVYSHASCVDEAMESPQ